MHSLSMPPSMLYVTVPYLLEMLNDEVDDEFSLVTSKTMESSSNTYLCSSDRTCIAETIVLSELSQDCITSLTYRELYIVIPVLPTKSQLLSLRQYSTIVSTLRRLLPM